MLQRLLAGLALLLAAAILIATGLWAWTGSDRSLQWAWDQVASAHGLQAQALRGSLREGLRARRLRWVLEDWEVEAEDVAITWQAQDLPALGERREMRIRRVEAGVLRLLPRTRLAGAVPDTERRAPPAAAPPGATAAPSHLRLPLTLQVDALRLGRFEIAGGWDLRDVEGSYRYDHHQHAVQLDRARVSHDTLGALALRGQARLGAEAPLPLDLRLQGQWEQRPDQRLDQRLALEASAQGPLSLLNLHLVLRAPAAPGAPGAAVTPATPEGQTGQQGALRARLAPWSHPRWQALEGQLANLDLATWWPQAPRTRLSGRFALALPKEVTTTPRPGERSAAGVPGLLQLQLHNALPGPAAEGRLPLAEIEAQADLDADLLRALRLQLGLPAGARWQMRLQAPVSWRREKTGGYALGPGALLLSAPAATATGTTATTATATATAPAMAMATTTPTPVRLAWEELRWGGGALRSRGTLGELPMAWLALVMAQPPPGDLVFDGAWDLRMDSGLALRARLARTRGDLLVLAETAEGLSARVAAGVREATLTLATEDGAAPGHVLLTLRWDSERAGRVDAQIATHLSPGGGQGWHWPADAPLAGRLQAQLPRLSVWSQLAPAGWRLRGALAADLALAGARNAPHWSGDLSAEGLGLRSVVDGIALRDGRLRARLVDRTLFIDELQFLGQDLPGEPGSGGRLQAQGQGRWPEDGELSLRLDATLSRLRASLRPDRLLTLSGQARAEVTRGGPRSLAGHKDSPPPSPGARPLLRLDAQLRVDQARITLPDRAMPQLGEDVVVRGLPPGVQLDAAARGPGQGSALPLRLRARIDLGPDFRVSGRGLEAQARGQLEATAITASSTASDWQLAGSVDMAGGHYQAFGQRLRLTRGLLRFTGPPRDPALDLLAQRPTPPGESQQVGVQISGRAQAPRVRLWSEPALPQAQALSWLALGRASAGGGGETALLEDLAVSLLTRRAGLGGGTLAQRLGLDELSLRRDSGTGGQATGGGASGAGGTSGTSSSTAGFAQGATLAVGKRLGQDLYAVYERGLSGVLGTLRVFYDLTRQLQLRLEAGDRSGVDLVYTLTRD